MTMNFNVFTAAAQAKLERVVWASSETTLGLPVYAPHPAQCRWTRITTRSRRGTYALPWHLSGDSVAQAGRLRGPVSCASGATCASVGLRYDCRIKPNCHQGGAGGAAG